nr:hypothetical protein [Tanacetum cinerariifolium]
MSNDDATGAESPPQGVDSYYRPGNFKDPSPIVYPAADNGAVSNFKIQPNLIALLPVFRGYEEPYAHLREFFSIADTYQFHEAFSRLKELLRTCPHYDVPKWELVKVFYDGSDYHNQQFVMETGGGTFFSWPMEEEWEIFEKLSKGSKTQASVDRNNNHTSSANFVSNRHGTNSKINELSQKVDLLLRNLRKGIPNVSQLSHNAYSMCGDPSHSVNNCQSWGAPSNEEDDDNYNRPNNIQQQNHGYIPSSKRAFVVLDELSTELVIFVHTDLEDLCSTNRVVVSVTTDLELLLNNRSNHIELIPKTALLCLIKRTMCHGRLVFSDDELTEKELKQIEADDQAIQTILLGLLEDIYVAVDSCETAQEITLRVQQMMKGSDIGIQVKKAKLFNEWERFTSNDGESIESYYHRFLKLMNNLKQNKHFPEKIAKWSRHVTIVHQTKDLHTADYTQLYDFLKYNQKENYMQQAMPNPKDITHPTTAMNMSLALMAKAFKLNYSTPTNNNQRISSNPRNRQIAQPGMNIGQDRQMQMVVVQNVRNQVVPWNANQNPNGNGNLVAVRAEGNATGYNENQIRCYNYRGVGHFARNCTVRPRRRDDAYLQTQLLIAQKEEVGIQLQAEEFDLMATTTDLDEIEEVNANCILIANLQQASTSDTQTDKAPVYDSDGSAEVTSVEQSGGIVEQHPANVEETQETLQRAQESHLKMKQLNKEIKPSNYTKINHLSGVFVSQTAKSSEELYFSNNSKTANVSKPISIPNEEYSDDTTPNVARKFLNEVKSTIVTLQRVVKHRMTFETHNWSSSAHQELHKIVKDESFSIVNQVDTRVKNFEIQFLKEAAKFVRDFKSLAKEADESLAKYKALELDIERLLKAVVSQDIMFVVQNNSVVDTSNL